MELPSPPLDQPKRLAILILLEQHHCIMFSDLYKSLGLSKGSVDSHLRALESARFITREVEFVNTTARSIICATTLGLQSLREAKRIWSSLLKKNEE